MSLGGLEQPPVWCFHVVDLFVAFLHAMYRGATHSQHITVGNNIVNYLERSGKKRENLKKITKYLFIEFRADFDEILCRKSEESFSEFRCSTASMDTVRAILLIFLHILSLQHFNFLLFSVPMFPFSYHSFQTDPRISSNIEY